MKIYLAARYPRREEMLEYAEELTAMGHVVTSRWVLGGHQASDDQLLTEPTLPRRFAVEDLVDLTEADTVISFTEEPRSGHSRGGRHVEFGIALAQRKRMIVVGHRENVFHHLPKVHFYESWEQLKEFFDMTGSLSGPALWMV